MSNFPQTGPYGGGPYSFHGIPSQYGPPPPPPPNLPYGIVPHQPFPQHRPLAYGQPVPPNAQIIHYANAGAFNNSAQYSLRAPSTSHPPQLPPQTYYGSGQFNNGIAPPPFSGAAHIPTYNAAAPSSNRTNLQSAQPANTTVVPRTDSFTKAPTLGQEQHSLHNASNGVGQLASQVAEQKSMRSPIDVDTPRSQALQEKQTIGENPNGSTEAQSVEAQGFLEASSFDTDTQASLFDRPYEQTHDQQLGSNSRSRADPQHSPYKIGEGKNTVHFATKYQLTKHIRSSPFISD